ncbi:MAG: hypothetical protein ACOC0N_02630, partial [Chroococcales cyanobacterium]
MESTTIVLTSSAVISSKTPLREFTKSLSRPSKEGCFCFLLCAIAIFVQLYLSTTTIDSIMTDDSPLETWT